MKDNKILFVETLTILRNNIVLISQNCKLGVLYMYDRGLKWQKNAWGL